MTEMQNRIHTLWLCEDLGHEAGRSEFQSYYEEGWALLISRNNSANVRTEEEVSDYAVLRAYFRNEETEVQKG